MGWTHAYNTFLYSLRGHMFRVGGDGRVTKYQLGPGGTFTAAAGYFEKIVKNLDGSFTITKKDQTAFRFVLNPSGVKREEVLTSTGGGGGGGAGGGGGGGGGGGW